MIGLLHLHRPEYPHRGADVRRMIEVTAIVLALCWQLLPTAHAAPGIYAPIHYQGNMSQIGGSTVATGSYNMRFRIYDAATDGTLLWTETWDQSTTRVSIVSGLFSVALGTHVPMSGVNFNTDSLYLQVEFDPGNDGVYEEVFSPRRRFGSVPYAHNAARLNGLQSTQFLRTDQTTSRRARSS
jgi:hypothetical protein